MPGKLPSTWLPRLLFRLTVGLSGCLMLLVLVTPFLPTSLLNSGSGARILTVFRRDATVRRTAVASAIGLLVTACVFFNVPSKPFSTSSRRSKGPPRAPVVGA